MLHRHVYIIKRDGRIETYEPLKLFESLTEACMSTRMREGTAETIAREAQRKFERWLVTKDEVTADDIRRKAAEALRTYSEDASYMYEKARIIA